MGLLTNLSMAEEAPKILPGASDHDMENHENGCGLDEVNAHRFLEVYGETLTVRELRRSFGVLELWKPVNAQNLFQSLTFYYSNTTLIGMFLFMLLKETILLRLQKLNKC